jgi:hypothetical protein
MAVIAAHPTLLEPAPTPMVVAALRAVLRHTPLAAVIALVVGIHIPTLPYYFFGDDFVALGDVASRPFPAYMRDVLLLRDLTPNWRPLTMAAYYAEYQLFGLDPMAWRIVSLSVHAATVALLYVLVFSMSRRVFVAAGAALIFGVSASAVHTVTYITAFPHVLSLFFLVASLLALHRYVESDERAAGWYWLSFLSYVAGFLANEGGVIMVAAILAYFAFASFWRKRDLLDYGLKMTPFVLVAGMLVAGLSGCGCQGVDSGFYAFGSHIPRATWLYLSRMAYPVDAIADSPSAMEWAWGSVVAGFALFFLVRGPMVARIGAVAMVAALMPYVPSKMWTATRYTYMALPFFGVLAAVAAGWVYGQALRLNRPLAHVLAALALGATGGLLAWQTAEQTEPFLEDSDRWELLTSELHRNYDRGEIPAGSTIFVIDDDGVWTNPYWQPAWMTSIGVVLYGDEVSLRAIASWMIPLVEPNLDASVYLLQYRDGRLRPASPALLRTPPG